jgi:methylmalonyl-CoA mutase C-terminal domain/subunit
VVEQVRARGADIPVVVGGIVPDHDLDELKAAGIAAILTPGATAEQIVAEINAVLALA